MISITILIMCKTNSSIELSRINTWTKNCFNLNFMTYIFLYLKKSNVTSNNNQLGNYIKNCSMVVKKKYCYRLRYLRWQMTARALLSCATLHSPTHPVPPICTSPASVCASSQSTPRCRKTQPRWAIITLNLIFFHLFQHCRARGTFFYFT